MRIILYICASLLMSAQAVWAIVQMGGGAVYSSYIGGLASQVTLNYARMFGRHGGLVYGRFALGGSNYMMGSGIMQYTYVVNNDMLFRVYGAEDYLHSSQKYTYTRSALGAAVNWQVWTGSVTGYMGITSTKHYVYHTDEGKLLNNEVYVPTDTYRIYKTLGDMNVGRDFFISNTYGLLNLAVRLKLMESNTVGVDVIGGWKVPYKRSFVIRFFAQAGYDKINKTNTRAGIRLEWVMGQPSVDIIPTFSPFYQYHTLTDTDISHPPGGGGKPKPRGKGSKYIYNYNDLINAILNPDIGTGYVKGNFEVPHDTPIPTGFNLCGVTCTINTPQFGVIHIIQTDTGGRFTITAHGGGIFSLSGNNTIEGLNFMSEGYRALYNYIKTKNQTAVFTIQNNQFKDSTLDFETSATLQNMNLTLKSNSFNFSDAPIHAKTSGTGSVAVLNIQGDKGGNITLATSSQTVTGGVNIPIVAISGIINNQKGAILVKDVTLKNMGRSTVPSVVEIGDISGKGTLHIIGNFENITNLVTYTTLVHVTGNVQKDIEMDSIVAYNASHLLTMDVGSGVVGKGVTLNLPYVVVHTVSGDAFVLNGTTFTGDLSVGFIIVEITSMDYMIDLRNAQINEGVNIEIEDSNLLHDSVGGTINYDLITLEGATIKNGQINLTLPDVNTLKGAVLNVNSATIDGDIILSRGGVKKVFGGTLITGNSGTKLADSVSIEDFNIDNNSTFANALVSLLGVTFTDDFTLTVDDTVKSSMDGVTYAKGMINIKDSKIYGDLKIDWQYGAGNNANVQQSLINVSSSHIYKSGSLSVTNFTQDIATFPSNVPMINLNNMILENNAEINLDISLTTHKPNLLLGNTLIDASSIQGSQGKFRDINLSFPTTDTHLFSVNNLINLTGTKIESVNIKVNTLYPNKYLGISGVPFTKGIVNLGDKAAVGMFSLTGYFQSSNPGSNPLLNLSDIIPFTKMTNLNLYVLLLTGGGGFQNPTSLIGDVPLQSALSNDSIILHMSADSDVNITGDAINWDGYINGKSIIEIYLDNNYKTFSSLLEIRGDIVANSNFTFNFYTDHTDITTTSNAINLDGATVNTNGRVTVGFYNNSNTGISTLKVDGDVLLNLGQTFFNDQDANGSPNITIKTNGTSRIQTKAILAGSFQMGKDNNGGNGSIAFGDIVNNKPLNIVLPLGVQSTLFAIPRQGARVVTVTSIRFVWRVA